MTHPDKNEEQALLELKLVEASVHFKARHLVDPSVVSTVHGPSDPINPKHY